MTLPEQTMRYVVVGADFRSADSVFRDRLYVAEDRMADALETLRLEGIPEAAILSTCDRTEIHLACGDIDQAVMTVSNWIAGKLETSADKVQAQTYRRYDDDDHT